jgi:arginyl-tRNA synthetase
LALIILNYHETIANAINNLSPHYLCNYLYELTDVVTKYYTKHRCIDYDKDGNITTIHQHHINMIKIVITIISKLFYLIGLEEVEEI